jgi:hypothetical protein
MQGIKAELDEHKRIVSMFQHAIEYSVYMTNIFFRLSDLKIKNKQIIKEKDISIQNLQGALDKGRKLKVNLQDKK